MTSEMFSDRFAYAVSVAQLRDGLQGTEDELRSTSVSDALEAVLDQKARNELRRRNLPHLDAKGQLAVEDYNNSWAEAYLSMVERGGSTRGENVFDRIVSQALSTGKRNP